METTREPKPDIPPEELPNIGWNSGIERVTKVTKNPGCCPGSVLVESPDRGGWLCCSTCGRV